jgi:hypothetical protein
MIDILLLIAVGGVAAFYILAPLALWVMRSGVPAIQWDVLEQDATVPHLAESHFWRTTAFLSANGFDRAGARVREAMPNGMSNFAQLWRNDGTGETAYVATTLKNGGEAYRNSFVVFLHERANGGLVATSNFQPPARTNLDPLGMSKLYAPGDDFAALRALHKGHCALVGESLRPIRMRDALTLCQALDASTRTVAMAQKRYRASGDALRITLWGAFYGVWINLPPLKNLYERHDRNRLYAARGADDSSISQEHRAA